MVSRLQDASWQVGIVPAGIVLGLSHPAKVMDCGHRAIHTMVSCQSAPDEFDHPQEW